AADPAESLPANDVLLFSRNGAVPQSQVHYGSLSAAIGATFTAANDTFSVNEHTTNNSIDPLANDTSIGGATNTLTITAVSTPRAGGTVTISSDAKHLIHTPLTNFHSAETFTYTVQNQNGEQHTASVTMNVADVNDPPTANNDTFGVPKNSTNNPLDVL